MFLSGKGLSLELASVHSHNPLTYIGVAHNDDFSGDHFQTTGVSSQFKYS